MNGSYVLMNAEQARPGKVRYIYSKYIRFKLKYNLYRSLVLSILTYVCKSWTISAISTKKLQCFENKSHRKLLGITCR